MNLVASSETETRRWYGRGDTKSSGEIRDRVKEPGSFELWRSGGYEEKKEAHRLSDGEYKAEVINISPISLNQLVIYCTD